MNMIFDFYNQYEESGVKLSIRAKKTLIRYCHKPIHNMVLSDVVNMTEEDMLSQKNCGAHTVIEIKKFLAFCQKGVYKPDCPKFEDDDFEPILKWAEASVEWSDIFVNGKKERHQRPELAHWSMCWKPGFIGFCSLKEDTEKDKIRARCASALFIYLWCKGVDSGVAAHSAEAYVNYYKVEEE